ncbi:hypothetical protein ACFVMC_05855 [Nocardia sp. NPDC127579]|uniref:hypothetical protein n=1 Tax=Nocardia sp. NPDC127579 TaxID=3345402 RepID=UPI00364399A5
MGSTMYLDLLHNVTVIDHSVWANPDTYLASDTYTQAIEYAAKKKKGKGIGFIGILCIVLVIIAAVVGVLLFLRSKKD